MAFELERIKSDLEKISGRGKAVDTDYLYKIAKLSFENSENHPAILRNLTHFQTLVGDYERASKLKDTKFHAMPVIFEAPKPYTSYTLSIQLVQAMAKIVHGLQAALKDGVAFHLESIPTNSKTEPYIFQLLAHDLKGRAYRLATAAATEFGDIKDELPGRFENVPHGRFEMYTLNGITPEIDGSIGKDITALLERLAIITPNIDIIRTPDKTKDIWYCNAAGLTITDESGLFDPRTNQLPFMMDMIHPMLNAQVAKHAPELALSLRDALVKQPTFSKIMKNTPEDRQNGAITVQKLIDTFKELDIEHSSRPMVPSSLRDKQLNDALSYLNQRSGMPHERLFNTAVYLSGDSAGFRFDRAPAYEHKRVNFYPTKIDEQTGEKANRPAKTGKKSPPAEDPVSKNKPGVTIDTNKVLEEFGNLRSQGLQPQQIAILILNELGLETLPLEQHELNQISGVIEGMRHVPASKLRTGAEWFSTLIEQKVNAVTPNNHVSPNNEQRSDMENERSSPGIRR